MYSLLEKIAPIAAPVGVLVVGFVFVASKAIAAHKGNGNVTEISKYALLGAFLLVLAGITAYMFLNIPSTFLDRLAPLPSEKPRTSPESDKHLLKGERTKQQAPPYAPLPSKKPRDLPSAFPKSDKRLPNREYAKVVPFRDSVPPPPKPRLPQPINARGCIPVDNYTIATVVVKSGDRLCLGNNGSTVLIKDIYKDKIAYSIDGGFMKYCTVKDKICGIEWLPSGRWLFSIRITKRISSSDQFIAKLVPQN